MLKIHKCQLCGNSWIELPSKPKEGLGKFLVCPACGSHDLKTLKG